MCVYARKQGYVYQAHQGMEAVFPLSLSGSSAAMLLALGVPTILPLDSIRFWVVHETKEFRQKR